MSEKLTTVDSGASNAFGSHLFQVEILAARNRSVVITEDYGYRGLEGEVPSGEERVILTRATWSAIRRYCPSGV